MSSSVVKSVICAVEIFVTMTLVKLVVIVAEMVGMMKDLSFWPGARSESNNVQAGSLCFDIPRAV